MSQSWKKGSCHCGTVQWEALTPDEITVHDCNCSVCRRSGGLFLILPLEDFRLLQGEDGLSEYRFGSGIARHVFCATCGNKSFYYPRSNPDGVSVNIRCMEPAAFASVTVEPFDGVNWEKNAASLAGLSRK